MRSHSPAMHAAPLSANVMSQLGMLQNRSFVPGPRIPQYRSGSHGPSGRSRVPGGLPAGLNHGAPPPRVPRIDNLGGSQMNLVPPPLSGRSSSHVRRSSPSPGPPQSGCRNLPPPIHCAPVGYSTNGYANPTAPSPMQGGMQQRAPYSGSMSPGVPGLQVPVGLQSPQLQAVDRLAMSSSMQFPSSPSTLMLQESNYYASQERFQTPTPQGPVSGYRSPQAPPPQAGFPGPYPGPPGQTKQDILCIADASNFDPDLTLVGDTALLSIPATQVMVQVLWAQSRQPVCPPVPILVEFPNLKGWNIKYDHGARREIRDVSMTKHPIASLPSSLTYDVRLQTVGAGGRTGFLDKENGVKIGDGILEYTLSGEGNLEVQQQPDRSVLILSCIYTLTGAAQCTRLRR